MSSSTNPSPFHEETITNIENLATSEAEESKPITNGNVAITPFIAAITTPPPSEAREVLPVAGPDEKPVSLNNLRPRSDDDVFGPSSTSNRTATPTTLPEAVIALPGKEIAQRIRSDMANQQIIGYAGFVPRADRNLTPNAANAQGLFPPDALVFVANLSNQRTEDQLELSCHQAFDIYGPCHIKVKFDKNKHPFALVQFETVQSAIDAINTAHGLIIDGRQIRLEQAKAERTVIITKISGASVSEAEARGLLETYGAIEAVWSTTAVRGRPLHLPQGMVVKFAFYLDCRDALRGFHNHSSDYRLQLASYIDPNNRNSYSGSPGYAKRWNPRSITDTKSIFVGSLPDGITKEELGACFAEYGTIVDVNIIRKVFDGNSINTFGFVEFMTPQEAEAAAGTEKYIGNHKLRVEPKEYSIRRTYRAGYSPATPPSRTPSRYNQYNMRPTAGRRFEYNNETNPYHSMTPSSLRNTQAYLDHYSPTPYNQTLYATPVRNDQSMLPYGLFSPTPPQPRYPSLFHGQHFFPSAYPMYMGTIEEQGEEHGYVGNQ